MTLFLIRVTLFSALLGLPTLMYADTHQDDDLNQTRLKILMDAKNEAALQQPVARLAVLQRHRIRCRKELERRNPPIGCLLAIPIEEKEGLLSRSEAQASAAWLNRACQEWSQNLGIVPKRSEPLPKGLDIYGADCRRWVEERIDELIYMSEQEDPLRVFNLRRSSRP